MWKDDALRFYGAPADRFAAGKLAKALKIPRQNVHGWVLIVPYAHAQRLRRISNGEIAFNEQHYLPSGKIAMSYEGRIAMKAAPPTP